VARYFDSASSQKLSIDSAVVTGAPFTLACWFRADNTNSDQGLISLADKDVNNQFFFLRLDGITPVLTARAGSGGTTGTAQTSTQASANTWHHGVAVFSAANDRAVYLDGAGKGTNTTSVTPTGIDQTAVGVLTRLTPVSFMLGRIAEAAIWNVALSDDDVASLSKGFSPLLIRPQSLAAYWPLFGNDSPEPDRWTGSFNLTVTGATKEEHVRIYYPWGMP